MSKIPPEQFAQVSNFPIQVLSQFAPKARRKSFRRCRGPVPSEQLFACRKDRFSRSSGRRPFFPKRRLITDDIVADHSRWALQQSLQPTKTDRTALAVSVELGARHEFEATEVEHPAILPI